MPHQITRGYGIQEVPEEFAAEMNRLKAEKSPLLNIILLTARRCGWRTESLAAALDIPVTAASKRMERAAPAPWSLRMREIAGLTLRDYNVVIDKNPDDVVLFGNHQVAEVVEDLEYLIEARVGLGGTDGEVFEADVRDVSASAQRRLRAMAQIMQEQNTPAARKVAKQLNTLARRLQRADEYVPPPAPDLVDASEADQRWLENMISQSALAMAALDRIPEFECAHPDLRATVKESLNRMRVLIQHREISADDAAVASARVREEIRLLKKFIAPDVENRVSIARQLTMIWNRLRVAEEYTGGPVRVDGIEVPVPPRMQTMLHGEALDEETIDTLRNLQKTASMVNGGTAPDSAQWRASRKLSELLWNLNHPTDPEATRYTAYYLARVMGITHHAVITRLRRYEKSLAAEQTSAARRNARRKAAAAA
jgi:hypothetical protein